MLTCDWMVDCLCNVEWLVEREHSACDEIVRFRNHLLYEMKKNNIDSPPTPKGISFGIRKKNNNQNENY